MSKKSQKAISPARENKTKEQVEADIKQRQEIERQRKIVIEKLWPLLLRHSKSIGDAHQFVEVCKISIQTAFNRQMFVQTVADTKMYDMLDSKAPRNDEYREFLDMFQNEKIKMAIDLITGVSQEIERLLRKEQAGRKLDTLQTDFVKADGNQGK
jgi:hypothetical protein